MNINLQIQVQIPVVMACGIIDTLLNKTNSHEYSMDFKLAYLFVYTFQYTEIWFDG